MPPCGALKCRRAVMMVQDNPDKLGRRGASRLPAFALGVTLAGSMALAFAFAMTRPPPPQIAWLIADIRITPGAAAAMEVRAASANETREPAEMTRVKDAAGRDLIHVAFPISRQAPIAALHIQREGQPDIRFSLNLPSDPPSTADFTPWLSADGPSYGGESAELRVRIERRISR